MRYLFVLACLAFASVSPAAEDALAEVNAQRVARGLSPFIPDPELTRAAKGCADHRASYLIAGHTSNDFAALPAGTSASASGCAAWPQGLGWGACCTYENYSHAGAAYTIGRDGRRYMHLFVRNDHRTTTTLSQGNGCGCYDNSCMRMRRGRRR